MGTPTEAFLALTTSLTKLSHEVALSLSAVSPAAPLLSVSPVLLPSPVFKRCLCGPRLAVAFVYCYQQDESSLL